MTDLENKCHKTVRNMSIQKRNKLFLYVINLTIGMMKNSWDSRVKKLTPSLSPPAPEEFQLPTRQFQFTIGYLYLDMLLGFQIRHVSNQIYHFSP